MRKGEDTFGDSESEEEDVVIDVESNGGSGEISPGALATPAAARPRLGLGASLASMVHNRGGPTCTLEDHPIQVCDFIGGADASIFFSSLSSCWWTAPKQKGEQGPTDRPTDRPTDPPPVSILWA